MSSFTYVTTSVCSFSGTVIEMVSLALKMPEVEAIVPWNEFVTGIVL